MALSLLSLGLAACGSGSGEFVSAPPAVGNPSPPSGPIVVPDNDAGIFTAGATGGKDRIIGAVGASQYFIDGVEAISIGYDARRDQYFVTTSYETDPDPLGRDPNYFPLPGAAWQNFVSENGIWFSIQATADNPDEKFRYTYSNLAYWSDNFAGQRGTVEPHELTPLIEPGL